MENVTNIQAILCIVMKKNYSRDRFIVDIQYLKQKKLKHIYIYITFM